jgi:hypothetical protein
MHVRVELKLASPGVQDHGHTQLRVQACLAELEYGFAGGTEQRVEDQARKASGERAQLAR